MIDAIRYFIGLQLMINGFVASVHMMFFALGVTEQFKTKSYVVSSIIALAAFLFTISLPIIDKFVMWIKH